MFVQHLVIFGDMSAIVQTIARTGNPAAKAAGTDMSAIVQITNWPTGESCG